MTSTRTERAEPESSSAKRLEPKRSEFKRSEFKRSEFKRSGRKRSGLKRSGLKRSGLKWSLWWGVLALGSLFCAGASAAPALPASAPTSGAPTSGAPSAAPAPPLRPSELSGARWERWRAQISAGPMNGAVGYYEARLWLRLQRPGTVSLLLWELDREGEPAAPPMRRGPFQSGGEDQRLLSVTLEGLTPGRRYRYALEVAGELLVAPWPLELQTLARWHYLGPPPDARFAIGSCAYHNRAEGERYGGQEEIFEAIRGLRPDMMLWLGDNIYLRPEDWDSRAGIFRRYAWSRSRPSLQPLLGGTHHYAIWDDHDYGPNDSNWSFPRKGDALDAFRSYWLNPSYGLPTLPGNFTSFSWSDVDFFLLDGRSFRAPTRAPRALDKPLLGAQQLRWLLDALQGSRATFKIVALGTQVLSRFGRWEGYSRHPRERDALIEGIKLRGIEGVLFLSGDRHHSELIRDDLDPHFYPLYEFTSSPLTSRPASGPAEESRLQVPGTLVLGQRNFGLIELSGRGDERRLTLESRGLEGELLWRYLIPARSLKLPAPHGRR